MKELSYTQQLRDFVDLAKQDGYNFELWIRADGENTAATKLSGPLRDAVNRGDIILREIPVEYLE